MSQLNEMFGNQLSVQEKEIKISPMEKNAPMRSSTEGADRFEDKRKFIIEEAATETMYHHTVSMLY